MSLICCLRSVCRLLYDIHAQTFVVSCYKGTLRTPALVCQCAGYFIQFPKLYSAASSRVASVNTELNGNYLQDEIECVKLQGELGCSRKEAQTIIEKIRCLTHLNLEDLLANLMHAKQQGISLTVMKENPWVLTLSQEQLDARLEVVRTLGFHSTDDAVPLLHLTVPQLISVCSFWRKESRSFIDGNRILYLSRKLRCPVRIACQLMVKYRFLQVMQPSRLKNNLESLTSEGVSHSNILKDIWSLRSVPELIKERLHRAKEVGLPVLKPWLIRCKKEVFERTLERHVQSQALLGSKSLYEFLADRLNCDVQTAKIVTERYPNVLHVNIPKINEILDFLQKEGFSMEQVQQVPRILCHSLETIKARLVKLRMLGFNPVSLMVLCQSQQDYQKLVHKLEQRKTKTKAVL